MAIKLKNAPQKSVDELKNALQWFQENKEKPLLGISLTEQFDEMQSIPHRIFNLQRDEILNGKGLEVAKLIGWRYILKEDRSQGYVIEIGVDAQKDEHFFTHSNEGDHVNNFISQYHILSQKDNVTEQKNYELNVLRVPSCYVFAIWLKEENEQDIIIPLAPVHQGFEAGKSYQADEFMTILKIVALEMQNKEI